MQYRISSSATRRAAFALSAMLAGASAAHAANYVWTGTSSNNGGTFRLQDQNNWSPAITSVADGDTFTFDGTGSNSASILLSGNSFSATTTSTTTTAASTVSAGIGGISLTAGQTSAVYINNNSSSSTRDIRIGNGGSISIASGSAALTFDSSASANRLRIVLGSGSGDQAIAITNGNATGGAKISFAANVQFTNGGSAGTRTFNFNGSGDVDVLGTIVNGAGGVIVNKSGAGTLTLSGANTYAGGTTVTGGTLALGASERLADAGGLTLGGGTFSLGGFSETLGALTLSSSTSSFIDFGAGASTLLFSSISGTGSLAVNNWTEGSDSFRITADPSGLLSQITINGLAAQAVNQGAYWELSAAAVPEPSSFAALAGMAVLGCAALRRRRAA